MLVLKIKTLKLQFLSREQFLFVLCFICFYLFIFCSSDFFFLRPAFYNYRVHRLSVTHFLHKLIFSHENLLKPHTGSTRAITHTRILRALSTYAWLSSDSHWPVQKRFIWPAAGQTTWRRKCFSVLIFMAVPELSDGNRRVRESFEPRAWGNHQAP